MKKQVTNLLAASGFAFVFSTILIVILATKSSPMILKKPENAVQQVDFLMTYLFEGDFDAASKLLYGNPKLGTTPEDRTQATDILWQAYLDNLQYEILGDCYASDSGLAVDVSIRYLDIDASLSGVNAKAKKLLNERVAEAETMSEIYDESSNYRQDVIQEILVEAVGQALKENKTYNEQTISLHLTCEQGQWWILPEDSLLSILSGTAA